MYIDSGGSVSSGGFEDPAEALPPPLAALIADLESEFQRRVSRRRSIEKRWLRDLAHYNGQYAPGDGPPSNSNDDPGSKSRAFVNMTRPKTKVLRARLCDIMFPTDERNWAYVPTPVPELTSAAKQAAEMARGLAEQAEQMAEGPEREEALAQADKYREMVRRMEADMAEARRRCRLMEEEVADQLEECGYAEQFRMAIYDMVLLGVGIMKGPVVDGVRPPRWRKNEGGAWSMSSDNRLRPMFWRVDPWAFFPDIGAESVDECESFFERHLLTRKQLRDLATQPGFLRESIRRLLRDRPRGGNLAQSDTERRTVTGQQEQQDIERYEVKEYYGSIPAERWRDFQVWYASLPENEGEEPPQDIDVPPADPLREMQVCIWFCQGQLLRMSLYGYDSGEPIYSVCQYERDSGSMFGFGVPHIISTAQRVYNSAWRALIDNMALAARPMIAVDMNRIEPADRKWEIKPGKIWQINEGATSSSPLPIIPITIPTMQGELGGVIDRCRLIMDDETSLPMIVQGEQGPRITPTASGLAILQNAASVTFREVVRRLDDCLTVPNLRRMYHWNMQFNEREEIKGDYQVVARGTSVLLVREMQAANLFAMATTFTQHPVLGPLTKPLEFLRKAIQSNMLPADELAMSDEEYEAYLRAQVESQQADPVQLKAETQMNVAQMDAETRLRVAELEKETALMKMAEQRNMKEQELAVRLLRAQAELDRKERMFAAQAALEARKPPSARGRR